MSTPALIEQTFVRANIAEPRLYLAVCTRPGCSHVAGSAQAMICREAGCQLGAVRHGETNR